MRTKSKSTGGYTVYAVSGTNTISFGIDYLKADTAGLQGFGVEREDRTNKTPKAFRPGYKVFSELIPKPDATTEVSTENHPVQSFVWDDFTCKPDTEYIYYFHPYKGKPGKLDRTADPVVVKIKTEPLFSTKTHDIFFNRGVASSQAYFRKFENKKPSKLPQPKRDEALEWLSRSLDEAILKFIQQAQKGDTLLGCFYEFRYKPVLQEFRKAIKRGVTVKLIVDAKVNEFTDKKGFHESFPRTENLAMIKETGIPSANIIRREAKKNDIQHNKFIVFQKKGDATKNSVWTGSTNISDGGIHGQTNVGHWIRDQDVAENFKQYWDILSKDPGGKDGDDRSTALKKNNDLKKKIMAVQDDLEFVKLGDIPKGVTTIFSPRKNTGMLDTYVNLLDSALNSSCITLAFGINGEFKKKLIDNSPDGLIVLMLLEKEDKPDSRKKDPFVFIGANNNVYKAWGSFIKDPLYQWTKEVNNRILEFNSHVSYVHSKFLLVDPLGKDPIIVTGSANFSEASTVSNDENMVIIRGDRRVADIYFTEFNRLFNHYYFRSVFEKLKSQNKFDGKSVFLKKPAEWLLAYNDPKSFKAKRIKMYSKMGGTKE